MTRTHDKSSLAAGGRVSRIGLSALLLVVAIVFLVPLLWMASTSIRPSDQLVSHPGDLLPRVTAGDRLRVERDGLDPNDPAQAARAEQIDAELADATSADAQPLSRFDPAYWAGVGELAAGNYREVWRSPVADFPLYLKNSLIVSFLSVLGMVLSSAIVAYGFARLRWRGRNAVFVLVLTTMMIPFPVLMAPLYILFKDFGWIGTFKPLWVPTFFGGAFSIFLLRQFFLTIPRELDEAAMIDGCSHVEIFVRIILPLSKPALVVVALFQFIASWNDFVGPLIFLNHQSKFTLSLGLFMYQSQHGGTPWNLVMAASVLVVLPVLALFFLAQRAFVEGIATKGIKE